MAKDVSILVLSWNTRDYLRECLASIPAATGALDCETICIDNASSDGSADMVEREFPWLRLVRNSENVGYARGNNQAYELAQGEHVLLLNSDAVLPSGSVLAMRAALRADASAGLLVPRYVYPDGRLQVEMYGCLPTLGYWVRHWTALPRVLPRRWVGQDPPAPDLSQRGYIDFGAAAAVMVRRQMIEELCVLFDEAFPLLHNDIDLCRRARAAGWRVLYEPQIAVVHHKSQSIRKMDKPWIVDSLVGAIRYLTKHEGIGKGAILWLAIAADAFLAALARLRHRGGRSQVMESPFGARGWHWTVLRMALLPTSKPAR